MADTCRCDTSLACPDCSAILRLMCSCIYHTGTNDIYSIIYHCDHCHADWELLSDPEKITFDLKRKFFG